MPTALVTGASGFVGRRLAARLAADGWVVRALMRTPAAGPWHEQHLVDLAAGHVPGPVLAGVEVVFHTAGKAHAIAEVGADDKEYDRVNVAGTAALLRAAAAAGTRGFVYFSSVKAVADPPSARPIDETFDAPADTPYGRSKRAAERLVLAAGAGGMHVVVLRPALVYGPGVKGNLERMLAAVDRRRFPPLPEVGNRRSMVCVDDLVRAALLVASDTRAAGRTYIVTDGVAYSTRQLYLAMSAALDRPVPRWTVPTSALTGVGRAGDVIGRVHGRRFPLDSQAVGRLVDSAHYSSARISRELGFLPRHQLQTALPEIVDVYRRAAAPPAVVPPTSSATESAPATSVSLESLAVESVPTRARLS